MAGGVTELDLHGKNRHQAAVAIDSALRKSAGVYRIRLIHGHNSGTAIRELIDERYSRHPKVLRVVRGANPGVTELVLREF